MINSLLQNFYDSSLLRYGFTAQGVGWKNQEAQTIRFEELLKVIYSDSNFTVNDLGCGIGDLLPFLRSRFLSFQYEGYDVLEEMISIAKIRFPEVSTFTLINESSELNVADYTLASGIFNLKFNETERNWKDYILSTLHAMNLNSKKGFSFNALTSYSDAEYMKPELYYSDPLWLFDYCKRNFAKNVALLHDYSMYDFTILVKKNF
ncbi:MAG: class I SAM-dependent methyltransferase [Cyclobacteriaceae bacterium]|nr:class I SAM-dependent methyltransferase [Cyclobacteriaceae bacterium]